MSKRVGIIFDTVHPLIEKMYERLAATDCQPDLVHWTALALGSGMKTPLGNFDVVYLDRMGEQSRSYATQMALLENVDETKIVNAPAAYAVARNKALTAAKLKKCGVPAPPTAVIYNPIQIENFQGANPSEHYIAKSIYGCCAYEIYPFAWGEKCEAVDQLLERDGIAVVQTFIRNSKRFIWRVDVVNEQVIVCNQRYAYNQSEATPLCNGTQGGHIDFWWPTDLPNSVRELALKAVSALNLSVAGVDILAADNGELYVLEVNPEPDITLDRYEFPFAIADYLRSIR